MQKYRVAVVGCGAVSKNHGRAIMNNGGLELVYAVDSSEERSRAFSQTYGGEALTDYRELFSRGDVDAVHIVTPHHTHPEIAVECLEKGLHVFCEKPLAIKPRDAVRMVDVSRRTGKRLGVCFQNRMNPSTLEAKELIGSGVYGKIVSAMALVAWDRGGAYYSESPWRGTYEFEGGGTLINQSIHTLDLLDYLCGGVTAVAGMNGRLRETADYEVEDSAMMLFRLAGGATGVGFCTNCYPRSKKNLVEIHLEKACLTVRQDGLTIDRDGISETHGCETARGEKSEWGLSHGKLIDEFYASLAEGRPFLCDGSTGIAAVQIVQAIQNSQGKFLEIGVNKNL